MPLFPSSSNPRLKSREPRSFVRYEKKIKFPVARDDRGQEISAGVNRVRFWKISNNKLAETSIAPPIYPPEVPTVELSSLKKTGKPGRYLRNRFQTPAVYLPESGNRIIFLLSSLYWCLLWYHQLLSCPYWYLPGCLRPLCLHWWVASPHQQDWWYLWRKSCCWN